MKIDSYIISKKRLFRNIQFVNNSASRSENTWGNIQMYNLRTSHLRNSKSFSSDHEHSGTLFHFRTRPVLEIEILFAFLHTMKRVSEHSRVTDSISTRFISKTHLWNDVRYYILGLLFFGRFIFKLSLCVTYLNVKNHQEVNKIYQNLSVW